MKDEIVPQNKIKTNVSISNFKCLKVIGKGYFGKVTKVLCDIDNKIYALKSIKKSKLKENKHVEHIQNERKLLELVHHPFIVSLKFAFQVTEKLYLAMEYCNGGELFYHIRKKKFFNEEEAKFYFSQIVLAIEHFHLNKIVYRDIKPENFVLDSNGYIKITDLGLAKDNIIDEISTTQTFCGTPEYLAPEVIRGEKYGKAVDIWCLGILLYEMMIGYPPFRDKNKEKLYKKIIFNEQEYKKAKNPISDCAKDLIFQLLEKDPNKRIKIAKVKQHPFFNNINFDDIYNMRIEPPIKIDQNSENKFIDPRLEDENPEFSAKNNLSLINKQEFPGYSYSNDIFHS